MTKKDLEDLLQKLRNCSDKLDHDDNQDIINEAKDSLALVYNLMLVDELRKIVCMLDNYNMTNYLINYVKLI